MEAAYACFVVFKEVFLKKAMAIYTGRPIKMRSLFLFYPFAVFPIVRERDEVIQ